MLYLRFEHTNPTVTDHIQRQLIDLHLTAKDGQTDQKYAEICFSCCFYEMFPTEDSSWETSLNGSEVMEILSDLNIVVNPKYLLQKYSDSRNHAVEVFHSKTDERVFAYFDLQKEAKDENDMFFFGLSFNINDESTVFEKIMAIYKKLRIVTPLCYDLQNKNLYNKVFRSYFYFYENRYNKYKRQLLHHNLKARQ